MSEQTAKQLVNCLDEVFVALCNIQSEGIPQQRQLDDVRHSINDLESMLEAEPQP